MKKRLSKSLFGINYSFSLGRKDKKLKYHSKWPIYQLDILDKNGLWKKFEKFLTDLEEKNKLKKIDAEQIENFYYFNSNIDFEITFFASLMGKNYVFKLKDEYYSYTIGEKSKNKIYARFYFNFEDLFIDEADD